MMDLDRDVLNLWEDVVKERGRGECLTRGTKP
jgi:hypothetical protein